MSECIYTCFRSEGTAWHHAALSASTWSSSPSLCLDHVILSDSSSVRNGRHQSTLRGQIHPITPCITHLSAVNGTPHVIAVVIYMSSSSSSSNSSSKHPAFEIGSWAEGQGLQEGSEHSGQAVYRTRKQHRKGHCTAGQDVVPRMSCAHTRGQLWTGQLSFINTDKMKPASPQCNAVMYERGAGYEADINKPEIGLPSMREKMMTGGQWTTHKI